MKLLLSYVCLHVWESPASSQFIFSSLALLRCFSWLRNSQWVGCRELQRSWGHNIRSIWISRLQLCCVLCIPPAGTQGDTQAKEGPTKHHQPWQGAGTWWALGSLATLLWFYETLLTVKDVLPLCKAKSTPDTHSTRAVKGVFISEIKLQALLLVFHVFQWQSYIISDQQLHILLPKHCTALHLSTCFCTAAGNGRLSYWCCFTAR